MAQSNIYSASAEEIRELFGDYIDGPGECVVLAVSAYPLDETARNAIEKSLESFGYGPRACTYATLTPIDAQAEGGDIPLDAQALFLLVEGLDPTCVICADEVSANRLGKAFRTAYAVDTSARVFGRPAVVFRDFPSLLATEQGKQQAWHLLKALPKR